MPRALDWAAATAFALGHGLRVAVIVVMAVVAYLLVRRLVPRAAELALRLESSIGASPDADQRDRRRATLQRVLMRMAAALLIVLIGMAMLAELGINVTLLLAGTGVAATGVRAALVVVLALSVHRLARRAVPRLVQLALRVERIDRDQPVPEEQAKRLDTLTHVLARAVDVSLIVIAGFMVLAELGFNIAPILAGAGIAGIAIGFGAQALVRDVLAGVFILLENQFSKGDVVQIAGAGGLVEEVNLRRTVLRDLDGTVHSVPNGEIRVASNLTRGWSRVNLNVSVGYSEDLDRVRTVLDRVGSDLAADSEWAPLILEAPKVLRVDAFEESGIALKMLATTKPIRQWDVAGELRRRIKVAFDAEGIQIPFPHRVVVLQRPEPTEGTRSSTAGAGGQHGKGR